MGLRYRMGVIRWLLDMGADGWAWVAGYGCGWNVTGGELWGRQWA